MSKLASFRLVPPLDAWPGVVRWAQGKVARMCLVGVFAAGLWLHGALWLETAIVLAATSLWPRWRRSIMVIAALVFACFYTPFDWGIAREFALQNAGGVSIDWDILKVVAGLVGFALAVGYHHLARTYPQRGPLKHPIVTWLASYVVLFTLVHAGPFPGEVRTALLAVALVIAPLLWFVVYSLLDRHTEEPGATWRHVGHWNPFWMAAMHIGPPVPKGSAYLRRIEAKDAEGLAVAQLKGVKLLIWAGWLVLLRQWVEWIAFGVPRPFVLALGLEAHLGLPRYAAVFAEYLGGMPRSLPVAWGALIARFSISMLHLAVWGHVVVATCRMAGFAALRNTYRPLESTSIAEFWNRYYYYFKELLVEVFFYPTFLRFLKTRPRTRQFVATLAAASGGNVLYHLLRRTEAMANLGPLEALWEIRVYLVYGLVLGIGIGVSQLRTKRRKTPRAWWSRRILAPISVLAFYCLLSTFDMPLVSQSIADHMSFLAYLLGIG